MATENEIVGIQFTTDAKQATEDTKKLGDAIEETGGSVKSLRGQLKEAVANVATMADKFGATSVEAVNAAKKAAELKDKIGDAILEIKDFVSKHTHVLYINGDKMKDIIRESLIFS